jgi:hypothetical protein
MYYLLKGLRCEEEKTLGKTFHKKHPSKKTNTHFRHLFNHIVSSRRHAAVRRFNPPEADKGLIPRRLRRHNVFVDTPLLCGGVVH